MRYSDRLITAPTEEPIGIFEVMAITRMNANAPQELAYLTALITAAREYVETYTHRQLCTATWQMILDTFPRTSPYYGGVGENYREINLPAFDQTLFVPRPPLQAISFIQYLDTTNTLQTWDPSQYLVDLYDEPGRITPGFGIPWPIPLAVINSVTVQYVAGYGAAAQVPRSIKHAIALLVSHWFANRTPINDAPTSEIPFTVTDLLSSAMWGSYILTPGLR